MTLDIDKLKIIESRSTERGFASVNTLSTRSFVTETAPKLDAQPTMQKIFRNPFREISTKFCKSYCGTYSTFELWYFNIYKTSKIKLRSSERSFMGISTLRKLNELTENDLTSDAQTNPEDMQSPQIYMNRKKK